MPPRRQVHETMSGQGRQQTKRGELGERFDVQRGTVCTGISVFKMGALLIRLTRFISHCSFIVEVRS